MTALTQTVYVDGVAYPAGTDHTTMSPRVVDEIRNPAAWVGGAVPPLSYTPVGKDRITAADLTSAAKAREALGVPSIADASTTQSAHEVKLDRDVAYRGLNLAGAAFGSWNTANVNPTNWRWPFEQEWAYLRSRGHILIRLPYMWERMQPDLTKPCDPAQLAELDKQLGYARKYGMKVILDNHNYCLYKGVRFGADGGPTEAQFAAHWAEMANRYKDHEVVVGHGLMNEPQGMPTVDLNDGRGTLTGQYRWYAIAQSAVNAIRATGDTTPIMVAGYALGIVNSWLSNTPGVGNKDIHRYVVDPLDNLFFEGHQYFDTNGSYPNNYDYYNTNSGQTDSPYADGIVKAQIAQLHAWMDWGLEKGVRLYLGEVGWPRVKSGQDAGQVAKWNALGDEYYKLLDAYGALVWVTAWAAGSKWSAGYELQYYYPDPQNANVIASPAENAWVLEAHKTFRARFQGRGARGMSAVRQGLQWRGQNVPVEMCSGTGAMVNGQEFGTVVAIDNPGYLARVTVYVGTAGSGNTADQCFVALYDTDTGTELARSADLGTGFNTTGYRTVDLTTRTRVFRPGELVGVKLLWNGTTPPQLLKAPQPAASLQARKFGVVSTGATALSSTMAVNSMTAATQPFWVAVGGQ